MFDEQNLLNCLREFYEENNMLPKQKHIKTSRAIIKYFGSWSMALQAAGLISKNPPVAKKRNDFTREQVIQSLQEFYKTYGRSPKTTETGTLGIKYQQAYYKALNCKSWNGVLQNAGLPPTGRASMLGDITRENALDSLYRFYNRKGRSPRSYEANSKQGLYSPPTYFKVFGIKKWNWEALIKKAGLPYIPPLTAQKTVEECIQSLQEFYKKHGRSPKTTDLGGDSGLSRRNIFYSAMHCKKWQDVLEMAELPTPNKKEVRSVSKREIQNKIKAASVRKRITKEQAVFSLQEFYLKNGRSPIVDEATKKNSLYGPPTYYRLLDARCWQEVLKNVKLPMPLSGQPVTHEQAVQSLKDFVQKHGRSPLSVDTRMKELYSITVYFRIFSCHTWKEVLKTVGLASPQGSRPSKSIFYQHENIENAGKSQKAGLEISSDDELLLSILKAYYIQNGETPKRRQVREAGAIIKRFGTWNHALEMAGLPLRRFTPTKEMLIQSLTDFFLKHQRAPKAEEAKPENSLFDRATYFKGLGVTSWPDVLELVNLQKYRKRSKDNNLNKEEFVTKIGKICRDNDLSTVVKYKHFGGLPNIKKIIELFGSWKNFCIHVGIKK